MSCCGGNCSCGSSCKCGNGGGCKMYVDISEEKTNSVTMIIGVAPQKGGLEGFEMAEGAESGCKCGANCTCDSCNCK